MSEALKHLRKQAKSLRATLGELPTPWSDGDAPWPEWRAPVPAPATVGASGEMSMWALTEHFLLTWIEWFQVSRLYSQYFGYGRGAEMAAIMMPGLGLPLFPGLPATWGSLHRRCQEIKDWVMQEGELADLWLRKWGLEDRDMAVIPKDLEQVFMMLVESHERRRLIEVFAWHPNPAWMHLHNQLIRRDAMLADFIGSLSGDTRQHLQTHLRFYRHATLDVSWLAEDARGQRGDSIDYRSAVRQLTSAIPDDSEWPDRTLGDIELDAPLRVHARALLSRVQHAVWEIGFTCLAEDVHAPDFRAGTTTVVGTPAVQLNPAPRREVKPRQLPRGRRDDDQIVYFAAPYAAEEREPSPIEPGRLLLIVNKPGGRGWKTLSTALDQLSDYLGQASRRPDLVVVLTDSWDSAAFARRHRRNLHPHASAGVRFLFLLAGVPDRRLTRIDVAV